MKWFSELFFGDFPGTHHILDLPKYRTHLPKHAFWMKNEHLYEFLPSMQIQAPVKLNHGYTLMVIWKICESNTVVATVNWLVAKKNLKFDNKLCV